jgi:hypothetical protein
MGLFDFVKGIGKKIRQKLNNLLQRLLNRQHKRLQISFWRILKV